MKILLRFSLFIILTGLYCHTLMAQAERTRDFNNSWNGINKVTVAHRHGPLEVITHSGSEVKLVAHISVLAKDEIDAQMLVDHFEIKSNVNSGILEIETKFNAKSWTTSNNNTKIKFSDGSKASGIKKIEIKYQLYVPSLEALDLSNKYNNIEVTNDFTGDLTVRQYDATIKVQNVSGKLDLILKYGRAYIGEVRELEMNVYDAKVEVVKARNVIIKSKYSKIDLGEVKSADINSYDGYCKIESVTDDVHIVDKYSSYEIGSARTVSATVHDGKIQLDKAKKYSGNSKYSTYDFNEIDTIDIKTSYDDNFNIKSINSFNCQNSKYTSFEIESLAEKVIIHSSYGDEFIVTRVGQSFSHFEIDCKYTTVRLPLSNLPGYQITANMKYGKLSYDEPSENIMRKENNEQLELRAQVGTKNSEAKVIISAYDSDLKLK